MKIQNLILPSIALGAAAALLLPAKTDAFTTIGGSLGTGQRDVRIFNNFTDAQANDNQIADPNFPGYVGAPLAIWKSVAEWGSRLHGGTGAGDPQQPNGIGSGGANFDAIWAGIANGAGSTNDNVHSELAGSSGGVLAFTETPISDGWRIMYYSGWVWHDGPQTATGGGSNIDLQGVSCHEYGHALGLGHTTTTGSTMLASIIGNASTQRSIEADDIAGVRFIYGVKSASKPIITSVAYAPGQVTINGTGFSASGNEVWFTPSGITATGGDPLVKQLNVASTGGGTQIVSAVPVAAGKGNVVVKINGSGGATLTNAFPFDPQAAPPCLPPTNFCIAAGNSAGPGGAVMSYQGTQSVTNNDLLLVVTGCPANKTGLIFYGMNTTAFAAFGNGFRCIASPFFRLPASTSNAFGDFTWALDLNALPTGGDISSGETWGFQLWYRDPDAGGANFNASDGLEVPFCP